MGITRYKQWHIHGNKMNFHSVKVGDNVIRIIAGSIEMPLKVTDITETKIICGAWEFSRETGGEIDEYLEWDGINTGSVLKAEK